MSKPERKQATRAPIATQLRGSAIPNKRKARRTRKRVEPEDCEYDSD